MIRALDSMELLAGERAAVMVLRAEDFARSTSRSPASAGSRAADPPA